MKHSIMFWFSTAMAGFTALCGYVCLGVPELRPQSEIFIYSSALFAVGMITNYLRCTKTPSANDE